MNAEQTEVQSEARRSFFRWGCSGDLNERDRRNLRSFNRWIVVWSVGVAFGMVVLAKDLIPSTGLRWLVALVPDLLGVITVATYVRFLRHADELVRKIHLESIALGFGAGLVFILGYQLADLAGAPALDGAEPAVVMLLMAGIGQWLGMRRYR